MTLIGDKLVEHEDFSFIDSISNIEHTPPNSILIFNYNENLLLYTKKNYLKTAIIVKSIKEAVYCNALNSRFIICNKKLARNLQKIADNYMFDSKILAIIESCDEIEKIALEQIDGAIYSHLISK